MQDLGGDGMFRQFRTLYRGHIIANVDMTLERGNRLLEQGLADSIAFGRLSKRGFRDLPTTRTTPRWQHRSSLNVRSTTRTMVKLC
jgi:hypothetical protein